jgi:predicted nucleic acid-binding protein
LSSIADRFVVVLDANVLYPFGVRDALLRFAEAGLYRARWSADILDEMVRSVTRKKAVRESSILSTRAAMIRAFPEAEITGHEGLIPSLSLPDEDDRHVLAAAIRAGAQLIVTENQRDFPAEILAPYEIETITADEFLVSTFELYPSQALSALHTMRSEYSNPAMNPSRYILHLRRNGLARLAALVLPSIDTI